MTKQIDKKIPELDLEILKAFVANKTKEFLISHPDFKFSPSQKKRLNSLISRRESREPLAYLTGKKEFFGIDFKVNKNVLIPRPESEHLVEEAIKFIQSSKKELKVHEMATGSGAIIISLAHEIKKLDIRKKIQFEASDISVKALKVAKENAKSILKNPNKIKFSKENILKPKNIKKVDLLIANPPYILSQNVKKLDQTVKDFEPNIALDGGKDGLKYYKPIWTMISKIKPQIALLELESTNVKAIKNSAKQILNDYSIEILKDLSGKDRIIELKIIPSQK